MKLSYFFDRILFPSPLPSKNPKIYYTIENKVRNEREITNDNNRRKEQFSSVEILFALSKREMNGRRRKNYLGRI